MKWIKYVCTFFKCICMQTKWKITIKDTAGHTPKKNPAFGYFFACNSVFKSQQIQNHVCYNNKTIGCLSKDFWHLITKSTCSF